MVQSFDKIHHLGEFKHKIDTMSLTVSVGWFGCFHFCSQETAETPHFKFSVYSIFSSFVMAREASLLSSKNVYAHGDT